MENYKNTALSPEERAKDLLARMTPAEKLAQLAGVMAIEGREERMRDFLPYGIGQISTLDFRNRKTYAEAAVWSGSYSKL